MGHVVVDTDGEPRLRIVLGKLVEARLRHGGRELLAGQAVAAADHARQHLALTVRDGFRQRRRHVEEQRLTGRAGLLGAVEHGHLARGGGDGVEELFDGERAVQADEHHAHLFAVGVEVIDHRQEGFVAGAHHDDHAVGVVGAVVFDEVVLASGDAGQLVHRGLHDAGHRVVERVRGFARLEVGVRVLRGASDERVRRAEGTLAVLQHELVRHEGAQFVVGNLGERVELVRGAEPVEEMHERHARLERGAVRDGGHVVRLLHARGAQHRDAGLAHGHDVLVVTEDAEALCGQGARGDVEHRRRELARDAVHVRDHQQQAL